MKAIIENDLTITEEPIIICEIIEILSKYSVYYRVSDDILIIPQQKITLDEWDMNVLFDEVFYDAKIKYRNLGGEGCDFALTIDDL